MSDPGALLLATILCWVPIGLAMLATKGWRVPGVVIIVLGNWVLGSTVRLLYLTAAPDGTRIPPFTTLERSVHFGMAVLAVAGILFSFGYLVARVHGAKTKSAPQNKPTGSGMLRLDGRLLHLGFIAMLWSWSCVGGYVALRFGSLPSLLEIFEISSQYRSFDVGEGGVGNNVFVLTAMVPSEIVCMAILWAIVKSQSERILYKYVGWALIVGLTAASMAGAILLGSRWHTIAAVLVIVWGYIVLRRISLGRAAGMVALAVALIAPLVALQGVLRATASGDDTAGFEGLLSAWSSFALALAQSGHFLAIERQGYIAEYVVEGLNTFPFGGSFALGFLALVPRIVWPEKPVIHEGLFVADEIAGNFSGAGFPPGLIGGLLLNFGPLGLIGIVIYGAIVGALDKRLDDAQTNYRSFLVFLTFGLLVGFDTLQSSIATAIPQALIRAGALYFVLWLLKPARAAATSDTGTTIRQVWHAGGRSGQPVLRRANRQTGRREDRVLPARASRHDAGAEARPDSARRSLAAGEI